MENVDEGEEDALKNQDLYKKIIELQSWIAELKRDEDELNKAFLSKKESSFFYKYFFNFVKYWNEP